MGSFVTLDMNACVSWRLVRSSLDDLDGENYNARFCGLVKGKLNAESIHIDENLCYDDKQCKGSFATMKFNVLKFGATECGKMFAMSN